LAVFGHSGFVWEPTLSAMLLSERPHDANE
jgi:hypothetical protein